MRMRGSWVSDIRNPASNLSHCGDDLSSLSQDFPGGSESQLVSPQGEQSELFCLFYFRSGKVKSLMKCIEYLIALTSQPYEGLRL